jgi:hypothetical protein
MTRTIKIISLLGFLVCLMIMYTTDHGIPGIRKFDHSFRLLDMRFHYSSEIIKQTFERISEAGRRAYQNYLVLDFVFIVFFLITMITISDAIPEPAYVRTTFYILCGLRAFFDIIENILLLHMLGQYPVFNNTLAVITSWITTLKFIMLYIWLMSVVIRVVYWGVRLN